MSDLIAPENTYALLIGIDDYAAGAEWTLSNPVSECIRFAEWLLEKQVPPSHIQLLVKTDNPQHSAVLDQLKVKGVKVTAASLIEIEDQLNNPSFNLAVPQPEECLLYFYWSGHGVTADDHFQYLIYPEAKIDFPRVITLDEIRAKLRGGPWANFGNQAFLVNACATYDDKSFTKELTPQQLPANAPDGEKARQFAVCAASPEQAAIADENAFFAVLLAGLKALTAGSLLPNPKELHANISAGYKQLPVDRYGNLPDPRGYFDLWSQEKLPVISFGQPDDEEAKLKDLIYGKLIGLRQSLSQYRMHYREMVQLAKEVKSTADILRDLSERGVSQLVDLPQYLEFFERVALSVANTKELQDWLEPQVNDLPALLELREKIKESSNADQPTPACYLYVLVPNTPPYQLTYKLIDATGKLIPTTDNLAGQLLLKEVTPDSVCQAVCTILNEDDEVLDRIIDIQLELLLPRTLLGFAADNHYDPHDQASTLEETYAIKLRWRERAEGVAKAQAKKWDDLGKIIHATAVANPQIEWFASERNAADLSYVRWKEQAKNKAFVGLQFNPASSSSTQTHALFAQALDQGIPYLIWPRTQGNCPACFCDAVSQAVTGIAFEKALDRLQSIRRERPNPPDPEHPGRYLSIFWDDPRRNPFRYDPKAMSAHQGMAPRLTDVR